MASSLLAKEIVEARRRKLRKSGFFTKLCYGCIGLTASVIALIIIISGQDDGGTTAPKTNGTWAPTPTFPPTLSNWSGCFADCPNEPTTCAEAYSMWGMDIPFRVSCC